MIVMFKADNLHQLADGAFEEALNHALKVVHQDMKDRPTNEAKRKVAIVLEFQPNALHDNATDLEDVRVGFKVKPVIPDLGPVQVMMTPKNDGLAYAPAVPENPAQMHLMDEIDRKNG